MILEAAGHTFTVHIRYDPVPAKRKVRRCTHVIMHEGKCRKEECPIPQERPANVPLYRGDGYLWVTEPCSRNDNFVRAKGRKLALGRALTAFFPNNWQIRKDLWEDFRRKTREIA